MADVAVHHITSVKARMADMSPESQSISTTHDYIIKNLLNAKTRSFYNLLPARALPLRNQTHILPDVAYIGGGVDVYRLVLQKDFIRFLNMRIDKWKRTVSELDEPNSEAHKRLSNKYLFGGYDRPRAVLVNKFSNGEVVNPSGEMTDGEVAPVPIATDYAIEFGMKSGDLPKLKSLIIGYDAPINNMPTRLLDAYYWYITSEVYMSLEESNSSKEAMSRCLDMIKTM